MTQQANESSIVGKNEKSKSSWNISCSLQPFLPHDGGNNMKYKYTITKEGGETEELEAMSWKKLLKSLLLKYPKFSGWCSYMNKHGHLQSRNFQNGKEKR